MPELAETLVKLLQEQKELLSEILEVLKQQNNNISTLLAKLEGFRTASELKQKKEPNEMQRRLSREIPRYIESFFGMKVSLEKLYREFTERGYKKEDIDEAIEFLKRVGRIVVEDNIVRSIPKEKPKQEQKPKTTPLSEYKKILAKPESEELNNVD